ncbi:hypothetical protein VY88_02010 [Azospirillum thiophilum]|uniref:Transmembrane protein n=1 Tax=Azospirillum thiophilum TaxID=528244 RepID=A0AAC8VXS1_9PROT|nr:hypothetical protein [Azospirillum thiophilum]ALG71298.1 hypothetical protein AL072_10700 [Azospirillum thiophilum]KJR65046.1 hypothetical protein VY88_02010 [Azospirillum thiophilum]
MTRQAFRVFLISLASLLAGLPLSLAAVSGLCALAGVGGVDRVHIVMVAGPVVWTCLWFAMLWVAGPRPGRSGNGQPGNRQTGNSL